MKHQFKIVIAGRNSAGEPDFYFLIVKCTHVQCMDEKHHKPAMDEAKKNGFAPLLCYDEYSDVPKTFFDLFVWETATVVEI